MSYGTFALCRFRERRPDPAKEFDRAGTSVVGLTFYRKRFDRKVSAIAGASDQTDEFHQIRGPALIGLKQFLDLPVHCHRNHPGDVRVGIGG